VTLVAFSLRGMRPRFGGRLGELLFKPLATYQFLTVRTYVQHDGEPGIHFLAEWLDNRLAVKFGPRVFGLPYRLGRIDYQNEWPWGGVCGCVEDVRIGAKLVYRAGSETGAPQFVPCAAGSLGEWLMERYTAFNCAGGLRQFFRVWHKPWSQAQIQVELTDRSLLTRSWPFHGTAKLIGANYSPGLNGVWMGWPHVLHGETEPRKLRESVPDSCEFV
jgi:uncharacterized protein